MPPSNVYHTRISLFAYTASIHFSKQEVHTAIQKYTEAVHLDPTFSDAYEGKVTRVMRSAL